MNDKINGIIYLGKVYVRHEHKTMCDCEDCVFFDDDKDECTNHVAHKLCGAFYNFKFSQELTDKLNGK